MKNIQPEGYFIQPPDGSGQSVLVLHAWWGLNDTIKAFCDKLADEGFTVFAPDLYHGKTASTIPEAETLGAALDENYQQAKTEIASAANFLVEHTEAASNGIAVIAFSLGVYYALDLADEYPDLVHSVVIYYGTGDGDYTNAKARYLGHFAETDEFEPPENVDALEAALRSAGHPVTFYRYPHAGHWFAEPDQNEAYFASAAELAWERTLAFLKQKHL